jgi:hypothetical protein
MNVKDKNVEGLYMVITCIDFFCICIECCCIINSTPKIIYVSSNVIML